MHRPAKGKNKNRKAIQFGYNVYPPLFFSMKPLVHYVAEDFFAHSDVSKSASTYIFPSKRACALFAEQLKKQAPNREFLLPEIYTFQDWMAHMLGVSIPSPWELSLLFWDACRSLFEGKNFEEFLLIAKPFLSDYNELDYNMVDAQQLFDSLIDIKEMEDVFSQGQLRDRERKILITMRDCYYKFKEYLEPLGVRYSGLAARELVSEVGLWSSGTYVFVGLNALNKAEETLLKSLQKRGKVRFYWDADRHYMEDDFRKQGAFLRANQKSFDLKKLEFTGAGLTQAKKVFRVACPSHLSQAHYLRKALDQRLQEHKDMRSCAVILPDESVLPSVLEHLPAKHFPLNVSMGIRMDGHPFFLFLIETLHVFSQNDVEVQALIAWIRNPLSVCFFENRKRHRASRNLLESCAQKHFNWRDLPHLSKNHRLLSDVASAFDGLIVVMDLMLNAQSFKESDKTVAAHIKHLLASLQEQQHKYQFIQVFSDLGAVLSAASTLIPYIGDVDLGFSEGLQIMGLLETRLLDFDTLFILSVNEGVLPSKKSNTHIPNDIREAFGLALPASQEQVTAYHFYRLLQRSKEVHLMYSEEADEMSRKEPSSFLHQIDFELAPKYDYERLQLKNRISPRTQGDDFCGIRYTDDTQDRLQKLFRKGVSATALHHFLSDPLDFFKQRVWQFKDREREFVSHEVDPMVVGSLMHRVLEAVYRPYVGEVLTAAVFRNATASLRKNVAELWSSADFARYDGSTGYNFFMLECVIEPAVREILEADGERGTRHRLELVGCERTYETEIRLHDLPPVRLVGTLDQVRKEDGVACILDYKTSDGAFPNGVALDDDFDGLCKAFRSKPYGLQFLMYAYLLLRSDAEVDAVKVGAAFFKKPGIGIRYLKLKEGKASRALISREDLPRIEEQVLRPLLKSMWLGSFGGA